MKSADWKSLTPFHLQIFLISNMFNLTTTKFFFFFTSNTKIVNHCAFFCCSFTGLCCRIILGFTHTTRERSRKNPTRPTRCRLRHSPESVQRSFRQNLSSTPWSLLQVFYSMPSSKDLFCGFGVLKCCARLRWDEPTRTSANAPPQAQDSVVRPHFSHPKHQMEITSFFWTYLSSHRQMLTNLF